MTLDYRPFQSDDLAALRVQERHVVALASIKKMGELLEGPFAWTAWDGQTAVACAGIVVPAFERYPALAWAFLASDLRRHMLSVTRRVRIALEVCPRPVYAEIDETFPEGVRWAKALGFSRYGHWLWIFDASL